MYLHCINIFIFVQEFVFKIVFFNFYFFILLNSFGVEYINIYNFFFI